nr:class I SAM-dependent methyltransferase [Cyanobacterium sp. uoEpiScrs1]
MQSIIEAIEQSPQQKITFADYMNLALYHPEEGYYSSGRANIGTQGDFFTASSLGEDFGELLAEQFLEMWELLGSPKTFNLIEVGAGSGLCAADILKYLHDNYPNFYEIISYIIVEEAQGLIRKQESILSLTGKENKVRWKSWDEIEDLSITGCIFSNELIDAFPVHLITIKNKELTEIYVTQSEGKIKEVISDLSTTRIIEYFKLIDINLKSNRYAENYRTEVNLGALDWLEKICGKLKRGYLLTIDYGYIASKYYHPQRHKGTLQCYYKHRHHNNPYVNIGQQDITSHTNFTALEKQGQLLNIETIKFTQQGLFLMGLGLGTRLSALSTGKYSFLDVIKRRDTLHQLIDPMGLGGFGVLLQGKGLTPEEQKRPLKGFQ